MSEIQGMFRSLDDYYPGSRRLRNEFKPEKATYEPPDPNRWDAHPLIKHLHGKDVEMFTIGALAKALGKREGTIRRWQDCGYLPKTPYRLPTRIVNGEPRAGRRLFTRSMVEAAIEAFAKRGLIQVPRVEWKEHPDLAIEVAKSWKSIQESLSAK